MAEYNAMDMMFGTELQHMGGMGHASSAFVDPGLEYTLGYSQVQLGMGPYTHVLVCKELAVSVHLEASSSAGCLQCPDAAGMMQLAVLVPMQRCPPT